MSAEAAPSRGFDGFSPETLEAGGRTFTVRRAGESDVPALVALLRDDALGAKREAEVSTADGTGASGSDAADTSTETTTTEDAAAYYRAFALIAADPNQLLVAVTEESDVVGTLQLSLLPSLSRRGTLRLQIEAVRVGAAAQGIGLGTAVFTWAHECGRRFGAGLAQLTTDRSRTDAQRFYSRLGYVASHEGLKLPLD
ncbi:GNAT family N-acetyltransferase [Brevibacterium spongiae]|uniref:GNAT family N-acetyltransferase n=1 Tax=Brevibacterium spongiae TaxID=2909672 RepID=A0ABY5SR14_9MICO|nr:GNAT family N-acetyltransferase [Brevibacterium spongiae]UVI35514.1 GNAT family N-acetyltransferase [Brevibacterium spongiae]